MKSHTYIYIYIRICILLACRLTYIHISAHVSVWVCRLQIAGEIVWARRRGAIRRVFKSKWQKTRVVQNDRSTAPKSSWKNNKKMQKLNKKNFNSRGSRRVTVWPNWKSSKETTNDSVKNLQRIKHKYEKKNTKSMLQVCMHSKLTDRQTVK